MAKNASSWSYAGEKKPRFISPEANVRFSPPSLSLSPRLVQRITSSKLEIRSLVPLFEIYVYLSTVTRLVTRKNRSLRPLNARPCRMYRRIARYSTPLPEFFSTTRSAHGEKRVAEDSSVRDSKRRKERIGGERTNEFGSGFFLRQTR